MKQNTDKGKREQNTYKIDKMERKIIRKKRETKEQMKQDW
jgi:hypothetical protein